MTAIVTPESRSAVPRRRGCVAGVVLWVFRKIADLTRFILFTALFFGLMAWVSYWVAGKYIRGRELDAPDLTGLTVLEALSKLKAHRISLQMEREQPHETVDVGRIIRQYPMAGTRIKAGTPIRVDVSLGSPLVTVPKLAGETESAAVRRLRAVGLMADKDNSVRIHLPDAPGGTVVVTDPPEGSGVRQGSKVRLMISSDLTSAPSDLRPMPNLHGLTLTDARELVAESGLTLDEEKPAEAEGVLAGQVFNQEPQAGAMVASGAHVVIYYVPRPDEDAAERRRPIEDLYDESDRPREDQPEAEDQAEDEAAGAWPDRPAVRIPE